MPNKHVVMLKGEFGKFVWELPEPLAEQLDNVPPEAAEAFLKCYQILCCKALNLICGATVYRPAGDLLVPMLEDGFEEMRQKGQVVLDSFLEELLSP